MKLLSLYKWIAGSQNDFTRQFEHNEQLFNQARAFWNNLESDMFLVLSAAIVLGLLVAIYYYTDYNNRSGRHYTPWRWAVFLVFTFVLSFFITLGLEYILETPKLPGASTLEFKIAIENAIISSIVYFITSVIWCYALPTNAYRLFKFG